MTHHRLPGGTDVSGMALFDVDALPVTRGQDEQVLQELALQGRLVPFPTDGDGGYLLHLFVNEAVPENIKQYCVTEDSVTGELYVANGRIAFGCVESAFQHFKPNPQIRSDAVVAPGRYRYVGYRTEIPEEIAEQSVRSDRTPAERWLGGASTIVILFSLCLSLVLLLRGQFFIAACVLVAAWIAVRTIKRHPAYIALAARLKEAQLDLPSIVVEMDAIHAVEGDPH